MNRIGFIGVGIMGKPMVRNLMKAGFSVSIYVRDKEKVQDVMAEGAVFFDSISSLCQDVEAIITMVGYPQDVEDVYFGKDRILESAKASTYLIDMTTTSPSLDQKIYQEGKQLGLHVLDAPVTGGDVGAINATLSVLVGGDKEDYEACMPIFRAVGNNINYMGSSGAGQHAKMANQIVIAGTISGICEALSYAEKQNLDLQTLFDAISTGAASSMQMSTNGLKIINNDLSPGFKLEHFVKDMGIAAKEAQAAGLTLSVLNAALDNYRQTEAMGFRQNGTQALIEYYRDTH